MEQDFFFPWALFFPLLKILPQAKIFFFSLVVVLEESRKGGGGRGAKGDQNRNEWLDTNQLLKWLECCCCFFVVVSPCLFLPKICQKCLHFFFLSLSLSRCYSEVMTVGVFVAIYSYIVLFFDHRGEGGRRGRRERKEEDFSLFFLLSLHHSV